MYLEVTFRHFIIAIMFQGFQLNPDLTYNQKGSVTLNQENYTKLDSCCTDSWKCCNILLEQIDISLK